ncbi:MAG: hypothetical protein WC227_01105 [Patescibacteria group bacterium]|jgi:hypothetical protein
MQAISAHWLIWLIGFIVFSVLWLLCYCMKLVPLSTKEQMMYGISSAGDYCLIVILRTVSLLLGITCLVLLILALIHGANWLGAGCLALHILALVYGAKRFLY